MWATLLSPRPHPGVEPGVVGSVPRAAAPVPTHVPGGTGAGLLFRLPVASRQPQSPVPTGVDILRLLWGSLGAPSVLGLSW